MGQSRVFGIYGILGMAFVLATPAALAGNGDRVNVITHDGETLITLSGPSSSAAAEIYAALDKDADLIQASVFYLNGAVFSASLSIKPGSTYGFLPERCAPVSACPNSGARLVIGGAVAQELFEDLVKAGDPETHGIDSGTVRGTNVSCSYFVSGGMRYSCTLSLASDSLNSW